MTVLQLVDSVPVDDFGKLWAVLRDTVRASSLSRAEKIGILAVVSNELIREVQNEIDSAEGTP